MIELTYSRELTKNVDLFPRTDNTHKNHARPIPANVQNEKYRPDIGMSLSFHVETVISLSHKKADTHINVNVEFGDEEGQIPIDEIARKAGEGRYNKKVT